MKKYLFFVLSAFLLFSCFWWKDTSTWLINFENNDFTFSIPSSWSIITDKDTILPKPKNGEIVLAVSSDELRYGFANNLLVLKQSLNKKVSSDEFSILNNIWANKDYLEYIKLDTKQLIFNDKDKASLYIFEAKYNTSTPKLKFLQVWKVCSDKEAYLITVALSLDILDTTRYEDMLKTFSCK